jgi:hypothetical protein
LIGIRVEPKYRSIARSLSAWGPKGEPDASIAIESEVTEVTRDRSAPKVVLPVCEPEVLACRHRRLR